MSVFSGVPKLAGTFNLDPPSIGANTTTAVSVTISGLIPGRDVVVLDPPALATGLEFLNCRVSANNTLEIKLRNFTAAAIDDTSKTWRYRVL